MSDRMDYRRLLNETPTVIGMITSTLQCGGSIDVAIRTLAASGPRNCRRIFSASVRKMDTKGSESLTKCLRDDLSELPEKASGFRRSVMMCISASESSDAEESDRMLRDAADIALEAVKEMGSSYGASLSMPCMTVFGLGIMVPMILMSILPMLSVSGMFGVNAIDERLIVLITIIVIPTVILMVSMYVRNRNPFLSEDDNVVDLGSVLPLLLAVPFGILYMMNSGDTDHVLLYSMVPASVICVLTMVGRVTSERRKRGNEQALMDSVFDIGNRMLSGTNFETSALESMMLREECVVTGEMFSRELGLCRGDIGEAIRNTFSGISTEIAMALESIHACSVKDADDAGRLAITLGRQFQNRAVARKGLELNLKSTTDMMLGTAMFFAPLVLGMSVGMLGPLSAVSGFSPMSGTPLILSTYLVELSALISVLTCSLGSGERFEQGFWRFCIMCPISLVVFTLCCSINF